MKALVLAWMFSIAAIAGGATYLLSYEPETLEAKEAERLTVTRVDKAPVLSSGVLEFDASKKASTEEEDCPSSC